MNQLTTCFSSSLDSTHIHQEYPRPQLVRDSYFNLNGEWEYGISSFAKSQYVQGKILVPFSPECQLSGVERVLQPDEYLVYRKEFILPENFLKDRVLLHFGAVDQECEVFLNHYLVGRHKGGYLAFCMDITDYLLPERNVLFVRVTDKTEYSAHARGKQKLNKRGRLSYLFYTPQSGIWKTVWMESVPEQYISELKITPMYDDSRVLFEFPKVISNKILSITILDGNEIVWEHTQPACTQITAQLQRIKPWTPDSPHLYDVIIRYGEDEVRSYFGMRKVSVGKDKRGILRFFLNNEPYFFNGVLDQGYWPESLLTPPSDEALQYDIIQLKEMGFNTIRKHIKIESDRFYYHCDKLGMLVWQDMPNGGGDYNMTFVTYLPNGVEAFGRRVKDNNYALFQRKDEIGRAQYYKDLKDMVCQLYNHPCVVEWTAFNEGWGQFDAAKATKLLRQFGGNRLINEACGWFDQGGGDIYSIHNYLRKLRVNPQNRVVALTEFGGYAYEVENHTACQKKFGYQAYKSEGDLMVNYARLWEEEIYSNLEHGLSAAIYTQTSDIEEEINGFMTYDREVIKFDVEMVQEINQILYQKFREVTE